MENGEVTWSRLCALSELAENGMTPLTVDGIDLLVVRGGGVVRVIPPSCPHMQAALAEGFFDGCVLTCAKHLWQWTIEDGMPMGEAEAALAQYRIREADGQLYADLSQELRYAHQCEA